MLLSACLDFIYPPACLHCKGWLNSSTHPLFCETCLDLVQILDLADRCVQCFRPFHGPCHSPFTRAAAAFDYDGPMKTLIHALKYGGQFYLAKGAAAFLATQWLRLQWPTPDFLLPAPISMGHWWERGYNQSLLLSKELSKLLQIPVLNLLRKRSGDYSQAALTHSQRTQLPKEAITLKYPSRIEGKDILLIDDVMTSGTTLHHCATALLSAGADRLYSLTLCCT